MPLPLHDSDIDGNHAMTTVACVTYEFRCSTCYQILHAPVDEAGRDFECRWCQNTMPAPDATPERIARAVDAPVSEDLSPGIYAAEERLSDEDIQELVRQRTQSGTVRGSIDQCRNPGQCSAARISRLLAQIADAIVGALVGALGALTVPVAIFMGLLDRESVRATALYLRNLAQASTTGGELSAMQIPDQVWPVIIAAAIPALMFVLLQLRWISTRGQTVGKRLLGIRIVNGEGHAPGFMRGVVLRNWVPLAVSLYPAFFVGDTFFVSDMTRIGIQFLSLANIVAILMEPPRCLHDHLAGTYVVDA